MNLMIYDTMRHIHRTYAKWPSVRIEKHHPHGKDTELFIVAFGIEMYGTFLWAQDVVNLSDNQMLRQALSNITARLFRKVGEMAVLSVAANMKDGGES